MNIKVNTKDLVDGVTSVTKALSMKPTMPELTGIWLYATDEELAMKCTDLMTQKDFSIPADVVETGTAVVQGKLFAEMVRKMPNAETTLTLKDNTLIVKSGKVRLTIQCIKANDFPEMKYDGDSKKIEVNPKELIEGIKGISFAISQDEAKPVLTGAYAEIGDGLKLTSTDAFQFAHKRVNAVADGAEYSVIIPSKALAEISRMAESTLDTMIIEFTKTHVKVDMGESKLTARLLDGEYIKYRQIIPSNSKLSVTVDRQEIVDAIDRAQLMARDGIGYVIMDIADGKIVITANSSVGHATEEIEAQTNGEPMQIAFNPKYCMSVFKAITSDTVCMDFASTIAPCKVTTLDDADCLYLIVPMRVKV